MRLIKVDTLEFVEYVDDRRAPPYGILSHRWQNEEVTYQDMLSGKAENKQEYKKLIKFCELCAADNYQLAWMDTCCIDKSSSAELSEAINSMYKWYQRAAKCYAYLCDMAMNTRDNFVDSEWFRRGWTLQELIAPHDVHFFDRDWQHCGDKLWYSNAISQKHKIPMEVLYGDEPRKYSVAQRMSWANGRQTTKIEDRAYSLMGIFDVNMPMLYGEGGRAFICLQEEINKLSSQVVERKPSKTTLNYARPQYVTRDTQTDELEESRSEPWEHIRDLGRGKCSTVSVFREISTGDDYVCKSVPFSVKIDGYNGMPSRLIPTKVHDEFRLMQNLRHKHIASVLMLFRGKTTWNMMMLPVADLNMGVFLANCIADGYPHERLRLLYNWIGCLITALSFAHGEGIEHGNIKPTNILIKDKTVYLTDFGSSYPGMDDGGSYWPPEPPPWGKAADVFSLGCVFVEMFTVRWRLTSPEYHEHSFKSNLRGVTRKLEEMIVIGERHDKVIAMTEQILRALIEDPSQRAGARSIMLKLRHFDRLFCASCLKMQ